jgi:hypothetical protein
MKIERIILTLEQAKREGYRAGQTMGVIYWDHANSCACQLEWRRDRYREARDKYQGEGEFWSFACPDGEPVRCNYREWGRIEDWKYRDIIWRLKLPECQDLLSSYLDDAQNRCDFWGKLLGATFERTTRDEVIKSYYGEQPVPKFVYRQIPVIEDYQYGARCIINWRQVLKAIPKRARCPKCHRPPTRWDGQCPKRSRYRTCLGNFSFDLVLKEKRNNEHLRQEKKMVLDEQKKQRRAQREEIRSWRKNRQTLMAIRKLLRNPEALALLRGV